MGGTQLVPEKITSPFQLMAAWFAMLVLLESVLLAAAANISHPTWASGYLVVFASLVVMMVIACVILMLTKFRPNLQDGKDYSQWLKDKNIYSPGYLIKESTQTTIAKNQKIKTRSVVATLGLPSSGFLISVVNTNGSQSLIESLKNLGFNVELYQEKFTDGRVLQEVKIKGEQEGIWIGSRVATKVAIQAIKVAASMWSELKYLHLSSDGDPPDYVHDQLFLGGATSAAKRYGCQEWRQEELLGLDDEMSTEAFHSAIRARYS